MAMPTSGAVPGARSELRTRTALVLESIALRHQIAVLERSRTRRPCFRRFDRRFWNIAAALVAAMTRKPGDRSGGDRLLLAPQRLLSDLGISITWSLARWASEGFQ